MREIISIVQSVDRAIISSKTSGKDIKSFIVGIPLLGWSLQANMTYFLWTSNPVYDLSLEDEK